jgi:hypothetical protein
MAGYNIWQHIQLTETSTGSVADEINTYLKGLGFTGTTDEAMFAWLGSLGHTGSMADRISSFERANTNRYS